MDKLNSFLRLIRIKNLFIILLIQIVIKIFLIDSYLNTSALSNFDFSIYLLALISIVAGGYIINDIYDVETDKINKPEVIIIDKDISKSSAISAYYILNLIGISNGFYAAYQVDRLWFGSIFIFFAFSLWKYSKSYKTSFLFGNLQVAFLTALSIISLALYDLAPVGITSENGSTTIFYIILSYSGFAFITTLIREIIKDLEDIEGDRRIGANTLAINYGIDKTRKATAFLILLPICAIAYFQHLQYNDLISNIYINENFWWRNFIATLYTLSLQVLLIILLIKVTRSNTKSEFHSLSKLCKIIILFGILSIPSFHLLYQN